MPEITLRLTENLRRGLWHHLLGTGRGVEEAAFLFANYADGPDRRAFHAIEWYPVPPEGFAFSSAYHFELTDETRAHVIKRAHDLGACLVELHCHDDPEPPAFSPSDLAGLQEFVPHVWWRLKERPYVAIVVAPDGVDGLAWIDGPERPERLGAIITGTRRIETSGRSLLEWTPGVEWYADQ